MNARQSFHAFDGVDEGREVLTQPVHFVRKVGGHSGSPGQAIKVGDFVRVRFGESFRDGEVVALNVGESMQVRLSPTWVHVEPVARITLLCGRHIPGWQGTKVERCRMEKGGLCEDCVGRGTVDVPPSPKAKRGRPCKD